MESFTPAPLSCLYNHLPPPGEERLVLVVSERQSVEQLRFFNLSNRTTVIRSL